MKNGNINSIKRGFARAVLINFSEAFDKHNYELLIAKLEVYDSYKKCIGLIYNFLKNRKQRVKINATFSIWTELLSTVAQGSVLEPLIFNIYLNDLFFFLQDIELSNFANDATPFDYDQALAAVLETLDRNLELAIRTF